MKELENKIRESFPYLLEINAGQRFKSEYYGIITTFRVKDWGRDILSIYGYDEEGYPRECLYPRDLRLIGKPIMLHNVLSYVKIKDIPIYNTTDNSIAIGSFPNIVYWDLSSVYLTDQNKKVIDFLNSLP